MSAIESTAFLFLFIQRRVWEPLNNAVIIILLPKYFAFAKKLINCQLIARVFITNLCYWKGTQRPLKIGGGNGLIEILRTLIEEF